MSELNDLTNFKIELAELLKKYNVTISADCSPCSDLQGVYGDYISASIGKTEIKLTDHGWYLDAESL